MDPFKDHQTGLTSPAVSGEAITPSDATPLPAVTRCLYVGGAGDLRVELVSGDVVTLTGTVAGAIYPLRIARVLATGTTATGLVALR